MAGQSFNGRKTYRKRSMLFVAFTSRVKHQRKGEVGQSF